MLGEENGTVTTTADSMNGSPSAGDNALSIDTGSPSDSPAVSERSPVAAPLSNGPSTDDHHEGGVGGWESPRQEPVNGVVQPRVIPPPGKPTRHTNQLDYIQKEVLKPALRHKHAWPFSKPVDSVRLNLPVRIFFSLFCTSFSSVTSIAQWWTCDSCRITTRSSRNRWIWARLRSGLRTAIIIRPKIVCR